MTISAQHFLALGMPDCKPDLAVSLPAAMRSAKNPINCFFVACLAIDVSDTRLMDVLVNPSGQIDAAIVGVDGFLSAGEKDVAVSFNSIKSTKKNDKTYLTLDTTKDALKNAPG